MSLFDKRISFKPFEYPEIEQYKLAINHSYWLFSEFDFTGDVQDFHVKLNDVERDIVKKSMLAISQVEVSVKRFWGNLGSRIPKSEFEQVGVTFSESEIRHADAYSHLIHILGLNDEFEKILDIPEIKGRVDYLKKYMSGMDSSEISDYIKTLALFSLFIENVSLFSQFLILKSFFKYKGMLNSIDNVITATAQEENIHALFGIHLINLIFEEYPEFKTESLLKMIEDYSVRAFDSECKIVDWIFSSGDLEYMDSEDVKEFIKKRFNDSLVSIGCNKVFEVDNERLKNMKWFDEETITDVSFDFFNKRPTQYAKFTKSYSEDDLF